MNNIADARRRWIEDRPRFSAFGQAIEPLLKQAVRGLGLPGTVDWRPKEMGSLLKKLLSKKHHTYDSLGDKIGARIIVKRACDIDRVCSAVAEIFDCGTVDDKSAALKHDKVGYQGKHVEIRVKIDHVLATKFPPDKFRAELQVRTLGQHLWAEWAHDTTYKSDSVVVPTRLERRLNLLAGLVEIGDNEFEWLEGEISNLPDVPELRILKALERHYYTLTGRPGNTDLSLQVIRLLAPLYGVNSEKVSAHLDEVLPTQHDFLEEVFRRAEASNDERDPAFMFQPEVLLIYDQLQSMGYELRSEWAKEFPIEELEQIANRFGHSFD